MTELHGLDERLATLIAYKKTSVERVAKRSGLSIQSVYKMMRTPEHSMLLETAYALADGLEVSLAEFLGLTYPDPVHKTWVIPVSKLRATNYQIIPILRNVRVEEDAVLDDVQGFEALSAADSPGECYGVRAKDDAMRGDHITKGSLVLFHRLPSSGEQQRLAALHSVVTQTRKRRKQALNGNGNGNGKNGFVSENDIAVVATDVSFLFARLRHITDSLTELSFSNPSYKAKHLRPEEYAVIGKAFKVIHSI